MTEIVYLGFSCRSTILILNSSIVKHLGHGYGTTREVGIVMQTLTDLSCKRMNVIIVTYNKLLKANTRMQKSMKYPSFDRQS
jgi:hypothetical protein